MLRSVFLYLSNQQQIFNFVRNNGLAKRFAQRFVAGETIDSAIIAVRALNAKGITASLDLLGESVTNEEDARKAGREYLRILDRIHAEKLDANVSLKLTAMGMDISEDLCVAVTQSVLERAQQYGTFVRLDMEGSAYTERTQLLSRRARSSRSCMSETQSSSEMSSPMAVSFTETFAFNFVSAMRSRIRR